MDEETYPATTGDDGVLQPAVSFADLSRNWIGLGAAIEWIAMRGKPVCTVLYHVSEDLAAERLVEELADLPSEAAESLVRGVLDGGSEILVPIPNGIWRQTATSDANDLGKPYRLVGIDDDNEWEGAIHSLHNENFRRVQIRTSFILDKWPASSEFVLAAPTHRPVAPADIRREIVRILSNTPEDLAPLTQREMFHLVLQQYPNANRDMVRNFYQKLGSDRKPGPRTKRDPERTIRIKKLGEKLSAAQLPN